MKIKETIKRNTSVHMADYERRHNGPPRGGGRKRRYRGQLLSWIVVPLLLRLALNVSLTFSFAFTDDDDFDRRQQRRRYEEPLSGRVRRLLFTIAESVRILATSNCFGRLQF